MKSDDVVEVNLVDRSPKETYRLVREMAAKIVTEDVEIRIYNGASREILKNLFRLRETDLRKGLDGSAALVTEAFSFGRL